MTPLSAAAAGSADLCPLCGSDNGCAMAAGADVRCWCSDAAFAPASLDRAARAAGPPRCLCARCATGARDDEIGPQASGAR